VAEATGLVQQLKVDIDGIAHAMIGPNASNVTALNVQRSAADTREQASVKDDIVNALAAAMVTYRQVTAVHGDTDSFITQLSIQPV
jgi:ABC-type sulfate transport system substrate-binding protein